MALEESLRAELAELEAASAAKDKTIASMGRLIVSTRAAVEEWTRMDGLPRSREEEEDDAPAAAPAAGSEGHPVRGGRRASLGMVLAITSDSATDGVVYAGERLRSGATFRKYKRGVSKSRWVWLSDDFERLSWAATRGARPLGSLSVVAIAEVRPGLLSMTMSKAARDRAFTIVVAASVEKSDGGGSGSGAGGRTPPSSPSRGKSASGGIDIERTLELEAMDEVTLAAWMHSLAVIRDGERLLPLAAKVAHHRRMVEQRDTTTTTSSRRSSSATTVSSFVAAAGPPVLPPRPGAAGPPVLPPRPERNPSAKPRTSSSWGASGRAANIKLQRGVDLRMHRRGRKQPFFIWCSQTTHRLDELCWMKTEKKTVPLRNSLRKGFIPIESLLSVAAGIGGGAAQDEFARDALESACATLVATSPPQQLHFEFADEPERDAWVETLRCLIHDPSTREARPLDSRRNSLMLGS